MWDFQVLTSKFVKFLMPILKRQVDSSPNLYHYSISWKIIPLHFFSSNDIYFAQTQHIKMKTVETFKCSGQNLANSSCRLWNDKSIPLQILRYSSVDFQLIIFQLWIIGAHQNINLEIFKCSGENLLYFSSHFPNRKSVESNVR